jgi:hypothetical protein
MSRKADYICLCHRCANGILKLPSGEIQAGKFVSRQTLNNHCKADEALYEDTRNTGLNTNDARLEGTLMIYL